MLGNIGFGELLLIGLIALLLFGPSKLPELGRSLGRTIREFKQGARDLLSDEPPETPRERKDVTPPEPPPQAPPTPAETDGQPAKQADRPTEPPQAPSNPADANGQQAKQADRQDSRRLPD